MTLKSASALPTWLVISAAIKLNTLPKKHPFRGRIMTLSHWADSRTALCEFFDILLWGQLIILTILVIKGVT